MPPFSSIPLSSLQVQAGRIRSLPHLRDDAPCLCFLHPRPSRNLPDLCTGLSSASRVMNRGRLPSSMDWSAPSSGSQSSAPSARTEPPWEVSFPRSSNCLCSSSQMRMESGRLDHAAPARCSLQRDSEMTCRLAPRSDEAERCQPGKTSRPTLPISARPACALRKLRPFRRSERLRLWASDPPASAGSRTRRTRLSSP